MNGDGKDDFAIGTSGANAYVLYGGASFGADFDLSTNLDTDHGFTAASGRAVVSLPRAVGGLDINGDGFSDVVIGRFVLFGSAAGFPSTVLGESLDGANGFRLSGEPSAVASIGDFNGDGIADLLIADPRSEAAYVVYGHASPWTQTFDLTALNGSNGFRIDTPTQGIAFGDSVRSAGDFNGDGLADLIIGASISEVGHGRATGAAYVVFGQTNVGASFDLSTLNGSNGFMIAGAEGASRLGYSMASAGDVNHDGFADIIVQAADADPGVEREGSTYLLFGGAGGFPAVFDLENVDGVNGVRIDGTSFRGQALAAATGDFNGDGYDDIAIGSPGRTPKGRESGPEHAYVVFGRPDGWARTIDVSMLDGSNGFTFDGGNPNGQDDLGLAVEFSDVNADGFEDLVVGAPRAGGGAGAAYVIYGHDTGPLTPFVDDKLHVVGTEADDVLQGTDNDETLDGFAGDDIFWGFGGHDQFRGGAGFDTVDYSQAGAGIKLSLKPQGMANTGEAEGDTFLSIEKVIGTDYKDKLAGDHGDNVLFGLGGADQLNGNAGHDVLQGYDGADRLTGGLGQDVLDGGSGADTFIFRSLKESPAATGEMDQILDFEIGIDKIDLRKIDADPGATGNQAFSFIGSADFSHVDGELRAYVDEFAPTVTTFVEGDVNGDAIADFRVELIGQVALSGSDFLL